jgi:hypothetical protein
MKTTFTLPIQKKSALILLIPLVMLAMISCTAVKESSAPVSRGEKTTKKERDVRIYPDMLKRMMHVKSTENSPIDFFVFDPQGTLMLYYQMKQKDHKKISGLEKGYYSYQVFKKDEMSETGKLIIK